jgi:hypothetical protein
MRKILPHGEIRIISDGYFHQITDIFSCQIFLQPLAALQHGEEFFWQSLRELYAPDDVLEEASAARYQMLPKNSKLRYQKELETFTSEWKPVSESEMNERETFTHWKMFDHNLLSRREEWSTFSLRLLSDII